MSCVTTTLVTGCCCRVPQDQLVDHVAHDRVQPGRRLVVEHQSRASAPAPGPGPRASACRRTARPASWPGRSPAGRPRPAARGRSRWISSSALAGVLPQRKGDVLADRHAVEQRRLLKQEAEADPLRASAPSRSARPGPGRRTAPRRASGRSRPMIVFSSTVLPQPLSPMMASVCPRGIVRLMSRSTCCRPKSTSSPRMLDQRVAAIGRFAGMTTIDSQSMSATCTASQSRFAQLRSEQSRPFGPDHQVERRPRPMPRNRSSNRITTNE